ncbi:MAG: hypothetical protein AB7D39_17045 [Pseudodesulfovibrio sp.]|uniref:hypothetical protein n=1 Tax=Pseudodesulfovibrio sp. TaxID=2035812 RepID=UPI003D0D182D
MSDKISPVAVVKQAVALSWRRKWTFLGLLLACFAPLVAGMVAVVVSDGSGGAFFLTVCVYLLALLFMVTTSNHLAVTMQRGPGTVLPRPFWPAMGRVFVRGAIIMALVIAVMIVFILPAFAMLYLFIPQDGTSPSPMVFPLIFFVVAAAYALAMALMLRLGIMIPGAAVGVVVGVREALGLTQGHSWRMFGAMLLVSLPVLLLGGIFQLFIVSSAPGDFGVGQGIVGLLLSALDLFLSIVMLVMNAIWYERLRLRAAGPEAGSGTAFVFESGGAPGSPADPRAGSGVGPYADLPEGQ